MIKQVPTYHARHIPLPLFYALCVHTARIQFWISAVSFSFAAPCLITSVPGFTRPTAIRSLQGAKTRQEPRTQNCEQSYCDHIYFYTYSMVLGLSETHACLCLEVCFIRSCEYWGRHHKTGSCSRPRRHE